VATHLVNSVVAAFYAPILPLIPSRLPKEFLQPDIYKDDAPLQKLIKEDGSNSCESEHASIVTWQRVRPDTSS
jgi:hypothetical protein